MLPLEVHWKWINIFYIQVDLEKGKPKNTPRFTNLV